MFRFEESELRDAVARCTNCADVLRCFGLRAAGGNYRTLQTWIARWEISTAHFDPNLRRHRGLKRVAVPLATYMVEGSSYSRTMLKKRLYAEGLKARRCELCGQGEQWHGRTLALILDHINGVADDHRLDNLRIVCPNCAATLETHCGRNHRTRTERPCAGCGRPFLPGTPTQKYCGHECGQRAKRRPRPQARRVTRPPYEVVRAEVAADGWSAVGRRYGVSDNAVRKWIRMYEREMAARWTPDPPSSP